MKYRFKSLFPRFRKTPEITRSDAPSSPRDHLADAIPHLVWQGTSVGELIFFNKAWCEYTGLSLTQSQGRGWQQSVCSADLSLLLLTWRRSSLEGISFKTDVRIRSSLGEERWFQVHISYKPHSLEGAVDWIGTCTDIQDRKTAESNLVKAQKEAMAASVSRASFLANMSHEIRTPMNSILGYSELMLDPDQSRDERQMCIETVQRNAGRLLKILNEILDISKAESGQMRVTQEAINLTPLIASLSDEFKERAAKVGLDFKFKLLSPVPSVFFSDPLRVRQILQNLADNAIKFTRTGFVHLTLEWKALTETRGQIVFRVLDSGVGVQAESFDLLFKPFVQEDSSITRSFGGAGLGLAHSRQLAKVLGGNVFIESSQPGAGSVFCLSLEVETPRHVSLLGKIDFLFRLPMRRTSWKESVARKESLIRSSKLL